MCTTNTYASETLNEPIQILGIDYYSTCKIDCRQVIKKKVVKYISVATKLALKKSCRLEKKKNTDLKVARCKGLNSFFLASKQNFFLI